jgi:hypothetical protein
MTTQSHHYATDDDQPLAQVIPLFGPRHGMAELAYADENDPGLILRYADEYLDGPGAS